jgi:hypothetical protein
MDYTLYFMGIFFFVLFMFKLRDDRDDNDGDVCGSGGD